MHWACRWLQHVKPRPRTFRFPIRPPLWIPLPRCQRTYSGLPTPIPENGGISVVGPGEYRSSYNLVLKVLAPREADKCGTNPPLVIPSLNRQGIYQLLQHVKEGVLPNQFTGLDWSGSTEFWVVLLKKSLEHDALIPDVVSFAQWWVQSHGVLWPNFYETFLMYYLGHGQFANAKRWHAKLANCPSFHPDRETLVDIINAFSGDPGRDTQNVLCTMYVAFNYRDIYDMIVPFLYGRGMSVLAMQWHRTCCKRGDYPYGRRSQAFLVFLRAYFPQIYKNSLPAQFHEVASTTDSGPGVDGMDDVDDVDGVDGMDGMDDLGGAKNELVEGQYKIPDYKPEASTESPESAHPDQTAHSHAMRESLDIRHGLIFGIYENQYNDSLGARWLASTWVSLDTIFNVIHGLGIEEIGPLSLQSIAIREGSCEEFGERLNQLKSLGIAVKKCNYTALLVKFTRAKNQKHLTMLLESDMHPGSFDDVDLLHKVMASRLAAGDEDGSEFWENARNNITETQTNILIGRLYDESHPKTLDVLDDMAASNLTLSEDMVNGLVKSMMTNIPSNCTIPPPISFFEFQVGIFTRLLRMRVTLPAYVWTHLLFSIGRHGHLDMLENLALFITQHILERTRQSGPGFMRVAFVDIPPISQAAVDLGSRRLRVPNDLPSQHQWHPLNCIFTSKLQSAILRWGTSQSLALRTRPRGFMPHHVFRSSGKPSEFWVARGIRLLRMLRDKGLFVLPHHGISKRMAMRLVELYGPEIKYISSHKTAREANTLSMHEFVDLCDEAWGEKLMPVREQLEKILSEYVNKYTKGHDHYIQRKGITIRRF